MEPSTTVLGIIVAGVAAAFAAMTAAMGLMWQRLKDKDRTIGKLVRDHQEVLASLVKDHRKELKRLETRVERLQADYVELLKEMAAALTESDDD